MEQNIDWLQFMSMVFSEVNINITDTEEIIVRCPDYVFELGRLIQKTSSRSVRWYWQVGYMKVQQA